MWLGSNLFAVVADAKYVEHFLSSNTNISKNMAYKFLEHWLGTGLLTSTGSKWKHRRRIITPTFHFKILEDFMDVFNSRSNILVQKLKKEADGREFDIYNYITLCALDIIYETAMGVQMNVQDNSNCEYISALQGLADIMVKRMFTPWLFSDFIFNMTKYGKEQRKYLKVLHDTTDEVIAKRKKELLEKANGSTSINTEENDFGQKKRLAFLDLLLQYTRDGANLTDKEIREEVDTFMFEGHDTTATAISFCLWSLATHPDCQEKVYQELYEIFGDSNRDTTVKDLQDMKYLDAVIKESQRIYPTVPFVFRELDEEVNIDDLHLAKGTNVMISPFLMNYNAEYFPEPEKFDPDRFSSENSQRRNPYAYVPFSAGPRNCIGQRFALMEMKSTISKIVRNYKITPGSKKIVLCAELVLRSVNGIHFLINENIFLWFLSHLYFKLLYNILRNSSCVFSVHNKFKHKFEVAEPLGLHCTKRASQAAVEVEPLSRPVPLRSHEPGGQCASGRCKMWVTALLAVATAVLALLLLLPLYVIHWSWAARLTAHVPGPKPLPLIGNAPEFGKGPVEFMNNMTKLWQQYGSVVKIWLGHKVCIMTAKPQHLEVFMKSNTNISKNFSYKYLHDWLGTGLLTSTGIKWKEHRKMITPAFHFKILEEFVDTFHQNSDILIDSLKKHVKGSAFDFYEYITLATLDIICETALGVSVYAQQHSESEYVEAVKGMANMVMKRSFTPWMFFDFLFNLSEDGKKQRRYLEILHGTTRKVIHSRKEEFMKLAAKETVVDEIGQKKKMALLDMLLETSRKYGNLTDEEIREEVDTFMFEGHDTTASGISFCLWLLGSHLDIQTKAYNELRDIFGDSNRKATYRDLQEMKYLECVIKETLRLYPSVPLFGRELDEDVKVDELNLPAGTNVVFLTYFLHRDSDVYPNPEKFDPNRFQPDNIEKRHPFAFLPFSAGPRNCIGQKFAMLEMKAIISDILRNYKVIAAENVPVELSLEIVLRTSNGIFMKIEER
ncbi:Probable cytochrome P450 4d14 [Gryllus bimaculatus]|nr:Probable cytochrome P450 4d14 [Gryllus bimaculatus]